MTINAKPFVVGAVVVGAILLIRHYMRKVKPIATAPAGGLVMDDASVEVR